MGLLFVVQPIGHLLDVGRHVVIVIHPALAAFVTAAFRHGAPTASGHDFGESFRALRANSAFAPPIRHLGHIGCARAAIVDAANPIFEMHETRDVIRRGVQIGQLAAAGRLRHRPFGIGVIIEPAGVINQMTQHMRRPARRGAIHRVNLPERSAGDHRLDLFVMLTVTMLMADHCLYPAAAQCFVDLQALRTGHRDRLFEGDQFRAACDSHFHKIQPQVGQRAEAKQIRLQLF